MKVVELSGGVGGALMARGLAGLEDVELTVVVNVGDDETTHGLHISPDIDTVVYTLAGEEGPHGWGRRDDTFAFNEELGRMTALSFPAIALPCLIVVILCFVYFARGLGRLTGLSFQELLPQDPAETNANPSDDH